MTGYVYGITVYRMQEMNGPPLQRRTLGEQLADRLRREVFYGTLTHKDRLTQDGLCARFGTSRIPVRDAIQQLVHEGVLTAGSDGVRPVELTEADVRDRFLIEARLHSLAAMLLVERATDSEIDELAAINEHMRAACKISDLQAVVEANSSFHRKINLLAKSKSLLTALRFTSVRLHADYLIRFPARTPSAIEEHDVFLAAVRARDSNKAVLVMEKHVLSTTDFLGHTGQTDDVSLT